MASQPCTNTSPDASCLAWHSRICIFTHTQPFVAFPIFMSPAVFCLKNVKMT